MKRIQNLVLAAALFLGVGCTGTPSLDVEQESDVAQSEAALSWTDCLVPFTWCRRFAEPLSPAKPARWATTLIDSEPIQTSTFVGAFAASNGITTVAAWTQDAPSETSVAVAMKRQPGAAWSLPVMLDAVGTPKTRPVFVPWVAVNGHGDALVSWINLQTNATGGRERLLFAARYVADESRWLQRELIASWLIDHDSEVDKVRVALADDGSAVALWQYTDFSQSEPVRTMTASASANGQWSSPTSLPKGHYVVSADLGPRPVAVKLPDTFYPDLPNYMAPEVDGDRQVAFDKRGHVAAVWRENNRVQLAIGDGQTWSERQTLMSSRLFPDTALALGWLPSGELVLAYSEGTYFLSSRAVVRVTVRDAAGRFSAPTELSPPQAGTTRELDLDPVVSVGQDGSVLVVWKHLLGSEGASGSRTSIQAAFRDPAQKRWYGPEQVTAPAPPPDWSRHDFVAVLPGGRVDIVGLRADRWEGEWLLDDVLAHHRTSL